MRVVWLVLAIIVSAPLLLMGYMMPMMGMLGWWWGDGMTGGIVPFSGPGMLLVWLVVFAGIGHLVYRAPVGRTEHGLQQDTALAELRITYASGDLTDDAFERRRETLSTDRE